LLNRQQPGEGQKVTLGQGEDRKALLSDWGFPNVPHVVYAMRTSWRQRAGKTFTVAVVTCGICYLNIFSRLDLYFPFFHPIFLCIFLGFVKAVEQKGAS